MPAFKAGDVVHQKGHSQPMIVESVVDLDVPNPQGFQKILIENQKAAGFHTGDVICTWFDFERGDAEKKVFHPDDLERKKMDGPHGGHQP